MITSQIKKTFITLVRPTHFLITRYVARFKGSDKIIVRYWSRDKVTGRAQANEVEAIYCERHSMAYMEKDFPGGCPECQKISFPTTIPLAEELDRR